MHLRILLEDGRQRAIPVSTAHALWVVGPDNNTVDAVAIQGLKEIEFLLHDPVVQTDAISHITEDELTAELERRREQREAARAKREALAAELSEQIGAGVVEPQAPRPVSEAIEAHEVTQAQEEFLRRREVTMPPEMQPEPVAATSPQGTTLIVADGDEAA